MASGKKYVIGIDVGTGSVRAGIFDLKGQRQAIAVKEIKIWHPQPDFVEQSSDNIWSAVCFCVKKAVKDAKINPGSVAGIGFDATCSLVALDKNAKPITISPSGKKEQNIIVWMDHRAVKQAEKINETSHPALKYVGGIISPEMEPPKLLWLKENMPQTFKNAGYFFDLADYLSFRATENDTRSLCTLVCKWCYGGHLDAEPDSGSIGKWDASFWEEIKIKEFPNEGFARIGRRVRPMGEPIGGLTKASAEELGLKPKTPVGVGIIDAHAGGLGLLGIKTGSKKVTPADIEERVALIGGTSTCHMAASRNPFFIKGIWGPYYSSMIPGMWLTEGGQSATGALIDHIIFSHIKSIDLEKQAAKEKKSVYNVLNDILERMAKEKKLPFTALLTEQRHILPYFHGNRSPRADPSLRGTMTGLPLDNSVEELALRYLSAVQSIAYGTRHIIETMNRNGYQIKEIFACGGGTKSSVYLREHADATGCRIILGKEPEAVLLGAAMIGAVASGAFKTLLDAMQEMNSAGEIIKPSKGDIEFYHEKKYRVFDYLYQNFINLRTIMAIKQLQR